MLLLLKLNSLLISTKYKIPSLVHLLVEMGQSFNGQAIRAAFGIILKPKLLVPNLVVPDIGSICFKGLRKAGFAAIAFDKDNTLTAPYSNSVHPPFMVPRFIQEAWNNCLNEFGTEKMAIVSNSAGSSDDPDMTEVHLFI